MATFLVVLRRAGPDWDRSKPMEEQRGWSEHAAFMDGLVDSGFLVLGGPLEDGVRTAHVVEAASAEAVRVRFATDPWSESHLLIDAIEPWTIRLQRPAMQPELWVDDAKGAVAFYERALGAVVEHRVGEGNIVARLSVAGARFWVSNASEAMRRLSPREIGGATGRTLLIVEDPATMVATAVAAGATETSPVAEEHGWLLGRFEDPFGHQWEVGRPLIADRAL